MNGGGQRDYWRLVIDGLPVRPTDAQLRALRAIWPDLLMYLERPTVTIPTHRVEVAPIDDGPEDLVVRSATFGYLQMMALLEERLNRLLVLKAAQAIVIVRRRGDLVRAARIYQDDRLLPTMQWDSFADFSAVMMAPRKTSAPKAWGLVGGSIAEGANQLRSLEQLREWMELPASVARMIEEFWRTEEE